MATEASGTKVVQLGPHFVSAPSQVRPRANLTGLQREHFLGHCWLWGGRKECSSIEGGKISGKWQEYRAKGPGEHGTLERREASHLGLWGRGVEGCGRTVEHRNRDALLRNDYGDGDGLSPGSSYQTAPSRVVLPSGTTKPITDDDTQHSTNVRSWWRTQEAKRQTRATHKSKRKQEKDAT